MPGEYLSEKMALTIRLRLLGGLGMFDPMDSLLQMAVLVQGGGTPDTTRGPRRRSNSTRCGRLRGEQANQ